MCRSGRGFAPSHRVDARIVGINVFVGYVVRVHVVSIDVVRVHVVAIHVVHVHVIPVDVVHVYVVVINVSIDVVVVVDVVVVHIATNYCRVDVNSAVAVIYVHAVDVNVMRTGRYPACSMPTVVVDSVRIPVAVVVEPRTDRQSNTKRDRSSGNYCPRGRSRRLNIDHLRVVSGNVNHLRLGRHNLDHFLLNDHRLLRS